MLFFKRHLFLFLLLLSSTSIFSQDLQEVPKLWERVTDLTNTLSASEKSYLENQLAELEQSKGSQIAVLIVSTTGPEPIEDYSIRVAEAWKIGREGVDDGVILLVAKNDRRLRIEVGYGLEGVITDAQSRRIIEDYITPRFKQGDFSGGISDGVSALAQLIAGEELPESNYSNNESTDDGINGWFIFIFILALIVSSATKKKLGSAKSKGIGSAIAFLGGMLLLGIAGGIGLLVFYLIFSSIGGGSGHGGYYGGGSSSGGGFSGGGGSFGGGGASGDW